MRPKLIGHSDPETWSSIVTDMVEKKLGSLKPYTVELNYDDWGMRTYVECDGW